MKLSVVIFLFALLSVSRSEVASERSIISWNRFPVGDPKNCISLGDVDRLEVLPGFGWDNLQNIDMGQVMATNYSTCKTTADRKYLLPDNTFVVPVKQSRVDMFSQVFDHWNSYTSATANSVNLEASLYSKASGSFSVDFQYNKEKQVNDKSVTTRVQIRHLLYIVKAHPEFALHPVFTSRLMQIAAELQNNRTKQAWYNAQLLVREYGTHFITTVHAGAALVQEDHVKGDFIKDGKHTAHDLKVAASATFFQAVNIKAGFENKASKDTIEQYQSNQTASRVLTHGGPPYRTNFTVKGWEEGIDNELVAIDRNGDPLHYAINTATLPGLPEPTVHRLANIVERAVRLYYKVNTVSGCTDATSGNFNLDANVDDGSCSGERTNFTFGGVYQKCYATRFNSAGNLCKDLEQKNPLTGDLTCPTGYKAVELLKPDDKKPVVTKSFHETQCRKYCRGCGFLWLNDCCHTSCQNVFRYSMAYYEAFWCAPVDKQNKETGMLFGGAYTSTTPNPVTESQSCPHRFYAIPLGGHSHICVSGDYELGYQFALPFAGFFSCTSGNPLAIPNQTANSGNVKSPHHLSNVEAFLIRDNAKTFHGPSGCPRGYNQHLLALDNECEINYCVKANSLRRNSFTPIKRPPYSSRPGVSPNATKTLMVVGVNGEVWSKNDSTREWTLASFAVHDDDDSSGPLVSEDQKKPMAPGTAAALSVSATLLAGILALAVFTGYKRHKRTRVYREQLLESYVDEERTPLNPVGP